MAEERLALIPLSAIPSNPPCCDAVGERNYRRGYYQGYGYALAFLEARLSDDEYDAMYVYLEQELHVWSREGALPHASRMRFPPRPKGSLTKTLARKRAPQKRPPITAAMRFAILQRDHYRCQLCGIAASDGPHVRLHVDHIEARTHGGPNEPWNLHTLCQDCNLGKGTEAL